MLEKHFPEYVLARISLLPVKEQRYIRILVASHDKARKVMTQHYSRKTDALYGIVTDKLQKVYDALFVVRKLPNIKKHKHSLKRIYRK